MREIKKTSEQARAKMRRASAQSLPDRPTAAGMKPDDLRRALWTPMLGEELSLLSEQDRIVDETNAAFSDAEDEFMDELSDERAAREWAIMVEQTTREKEIADEQQARKSAIEALTKRADEHDADEASYRKQIAQEIANEQNARILSVNDEMRLRMLADNKEKEERERAIEALTKREDERAVAHDADEASHRKEVSLRLYAVEAFCSGNSRGYVIKGLDELEKLLNCELNEITNENLNTGDNILLVQENVPDFWFESTADASRADTYTYIELDDDGNERWRKEYNLVVKGEFVDMVGVLHVLESDYTAIEGQLRRASAVASEAKEAAQDVSKALGDYVRKTDYGSFAKAGLVKGSTTYGVTVDGTNGMLFVNAANKSVIAEKKDEYKPIVPKYLNYAVKVALTTNTEILTGDEKKAALEWLGVKEDKYFKTETSSTPHMSPVVEIPQNVKQYAYVAEIHGAHSTQVIIEDQGYEGIVRNYPKVIRDPYEGEIFFALPDDVCSRLTDFGIEGNYIFFEDGKAYYKQTRRVGERDPELADGERIVETIDLTATIIELAGAVVTDVSGYITFDGLIDLGGLTDKEGEERYIDVEWKVYESDVEESTVPDVNGDKIYTFRIPIVKIRFELQ